MIRKTSMDTKERPIMDELNAPVGNRTTSLLQLTATGLLGIFIFFVAIPHTTTIKEICFYLACAITLFLVLTKRMPWSFRTPLTLPFVLFSIWAFIGLFFAIDKPNSIHDFITHLIEYIVLYYLLIHYYNSRNHLILLSWIIVSSLTVFSIGGMIYFYGIAGSDLTGDPIHFQEMEINNIGFSTLVAVMIGLTIFGWQKRWEIKGLLLLSLTSIGMITLLTRSRGAVLGLIVSLLALFPSRKKIVSAFFCVMALFILVLPVKDRLTLDSIRHNVLEEERIIIWMACLEMAKDHPLTGTGYGMEIWKNTDLWNYYIDRVTNHQKIKTQNPHSHNVLLSILTRMGFIGLAIFIFLLIRFAGMCKLLIEKGRDPVVRDWGFGLIAAFLAHFVKGMFEPGWDQVPAIFLYLVFTMVTILYRLETKTDVKGLTSASS